MIVDETERLKLELAIAIKLYAKARKITIDEATDNVVDAADLALEARGLVADRGDLERN
jgi:hypothetical protein